MSDIDSVLSEVSDADLLSQSEGEIELSEKSDSNPELSEDDKSIENSDSETGNSDSENSDSIDDDEPWILPDEGNNTVPSDLNVLADDVELSDSSDSEVDDDNEDDELKKIEKANQNEELLDFHPEIKQINYKELQTLCKITRDKHGNIIDPLHTTIPIITRYEKAKILGLRAKQINSGSSIFVNVNKNIIDGHIIAKMELEEKKIPFIIRRPIPNGGSEYWRVSDLEVMD